MNARKAVELALLVQKRLVIAVSIRRDVTIPDLKSAQLRLSTAEDRPLKVIVDIEHSHCGDFVVTLKPPPGMPASGISCCTTARVD